MEENENISKLENIQFMKFDPSKGNAENIPNAAGNYLICLKSKTHLPYHEHNVLMTDYNGLCVIYTGIAGKSLRSRDFHQHFTGNNAGRSTLRKSLGALFGYKQVPRDKGKDNGKTKFSAHDEEKLTDWMKENLMLFYAKNDSAKEIEDELINKFNPPLNLANNKNRINSVFRKTVSLLRNNK